MLRLTKRKAAFPEPAVVAQWDDFEPSKDEKNDADTRNEPTLVSVWNEEHTTEPQARVFYGRDGASFRLQVEKIEDAATEDGKGRFSTLTDPYAPEAGPGAQGHCGITGTRRRDGEARPAWRDALGRLAACAVAC